MEAEPIKVLLLLRRKSGMSRDDFIRYYEENHSTLVLEMIPCIVKYNRNYIIPGQIFNIGDSGEEVTFDYDVVAEVWYRNQQELDAAQADLARPEFRERLRNDERCLFDTMGDGMLLMPIEQRVSVGMDY